MKNAVKSIIKRRRQLSLTVAGIAVGVFSVLLISMIAAAGSAAISAELNSLGFDCVTITANDEQYNFLREESVELIRAQEAVAVASPVMTATGQIVMHDYICDAMLCGVDANADEIVSMEIACGRFLDSADVQESARVCVVNEKVAQAFYQRTNIVGKCMEITVEGYTERFTVVGVIGAGSGAVAGIASAYIPCMVYLPYSSFEGITGRTQLDMVFVRLSAGAEATAAEDIVNTLSFSDGYRNLYKQQDLAAQKENISAIIDAVAAVLSAIGAVSLLVSGLSIITIMVSSVNERTREIGIKKALGARKRDILLEFLTESTVITLFGSGCGTTAAYLAALAVSAAVGVTLPVDALFLLRVMLLALALGVVFGVYPAARAARLSPLEALRRE